MDGKSHIRSSVATYIATLDLGSNSVVEIWKLHTTYEVVKVKIVSSRDPPTS